MASSSKSTGPYDVFLSFRGPDVRYSFASHLYNALVQNGIPTFRDDEELRKGEDMSMLLKAIEESHIAIIIFSKNYTFSWWCLEEVAKIMECNEQKVLTVRPVFYKVDPSEVRNGRASYAQGLAEQESKHGKNSKEMERWKKALLDAGRKSGWTLNDRDDEAKAIQEIVKDILTRLSQTPFVVAEHPVGLESRVAEVKSMLNLESKNDVLMVGLWGQGGIGKTTLGRAIYNDISKSFDGSSFLANVREKSKDGMGLVTLQEQLLNDILLPCTKLTVSDVARGKSLIPDRLHCKRVLVILDDVDHEDQLCALAEKANWFGIGSRILITTRHRDLLTRTIDRDRVDVYEVEGLEHGEACALLSMHAFPTYEKLESRTDLLYRFLNHAKGLPLALKVLGSLLRGTTEDVWESILEKLSMTPNKEINNVLKVSYDKLEENEQEIFLHIACFFKGRSREYTKRVLDSCDLQTAIGFDILIKRCLIRIEDRRLQMHDLIQWMGRDIVNQENQNDPGKRSRLWQHEDVLDVLSRNMRDCDVKAIVLESYDLKEICIGPDAFTKMRNLRLLILREVSFQGHVCLPHQLRCLEWVECNPEIPEFSPGPNKLVVLDVWRYGRPPGEPKQFEVPREPKQFGDFQKLKEIHFDRLDSLVCTPDLSRAPNLMELRLSSCKNLEKAHESIANHKELRVVEISRCSKLSYFPALHSKALQVIRITSCPNLERFPDIPHELEGLKELFFYYTSIKEVPASIEYLVSLRRMTLGYCDELISLPSGIYKLQNLEELELCSCEKLTSFPKYEESADPGMKTGLSKLRRLHISRSNLAEVEFLENLACAPLLKSLDLRFNNITSLPTSMHKRDHLFTLRVPHCHQLREIPKLPPSVIFFDAQNCCSLKNKDHLTLFQDFVRRGLAMANISPLDQEDPKGIIRSYSWFSSFVGSFDRFGQERPRCSIFIPRCQMPEWILPVEGDSISFMASENLHHKFLGLSLCIVVREFNDKTDLEIELHVNGKSRGFRKKDYVCLYSDHIWIHYFVNLWGEVDFGQIEGRHARFSFRVRGGIVIKWGLRIICKQLNDDLEKEIRDDQLMDPALLYEISYDSIDPEGKSSIMHEDSLSEADPQEHLQDCQMSIGAHSQIVPKRNHKLVLPQGMQTKTMSTSNSIGRYENGGAGLQLLLSE